MKCQYQAVMSTTIRRASTGLCSREALAAHSSAIIPPPGARRAPSSADTQTNCWDSYPDRIRDRAVRPTPSIARPETRSPAPPSRPATGKYLLLAERNSRNRSHRSQRRLPRHLRRASSMVTLLTSSRAVLIASSSQGRSTWPQSRTYLLDCRQTWAAPAARHRRWSAK